MLNPITLHQNYHFSTVCRLNSRFRKLLDFKSKLYYISRYIFAVRRLINFAFIIIIIIIIISITIIINLTFRYLVGHKLANGAFGEVRLTTDQATNDELAVKLENSNAKTPMLFLEYRIYKVCIETLN